MLPSKLAALKKELEEMFHNGQIDIDDKVSLLMLRQLETRHLDNRKPDDLIKSLTVAGNVCPCCGKAY